FAKFKDAEAVQYFYEPFLEAFDPDLRKQLGVWYTPPEIVKYMVGRVDQVLRSDFGRPDGLADPGVYVLDPCCGTGAYLVEVLNTIAGTLADSQKTTRPVVTIVCGSLLRHRPVFEGQLTALSG